MTKRNLRTFTYPDPLFRRTAAPENEYDGPRYGSPPPYQPRVQLSAYVNIGNEDPQLILPFFPDGREVVTTLAKVSIPEKGGESWIATKVVNGFDEHDIKRARDLNTRVEGWIAELTADLPEDSVRTDVIFQYQDEAQYTGQHTRTATQMGARVGDFEVYDYNTKQTLANSIRVSFSEEVSLEEQVDISTRLLQRLGVKREQLNEFREEFGLEQLKPLWRQRIENMMDSIRPRADGPEDQPAR